MALFSKYVVKDCQQSCLNPDLFLFMVIWTVCPLGDVTRLQLQSSRWDFENHKRWSQSSQTFIMWREITALHFLMLTNLLIYIVKTVLVMQCTYMIIGLYRVCINHILNGVMSYICSINDFYSSYSITNSIISSLPGLNIYYWMFVLQEAKYSQLLHSDSHRNMNIDFWNVEIKTDCQTLSCIFLSLYLSTKPSITT